MRNTLTAALFALLVPAAALAQAAAPDPPAPHNQILSTNPFGVIVKWANVEYERKVTPAATLGASASYFGEAGDSNAAIVLRWYPQQRALTGFYLGARAGAYRFTTSNYDFRAHHERTSVLPGAGVEMGYNWLLGPKQNVSVGLGFGLTRVLGADDAPGVPSVIPGLRLVNIGIAF